MSEQLLEQIPEFKKKEAGAQSEQEGLANWSALTSVPTARNTGEALVIAAVAVLVVGSAEILLRAFQVPAYIFPLPSGIFRALFESWDVLWPHLLITLQELLIGYAIGAV